MRSRSTSPASSASSFDVAWRVDREGQLVRRHAVPVVGDQDARQAAAVGLDLDPGGAGVERVLDQLLDGARRAFDHLAGGDAVDGFGGEAADGHGIRQYGPFRLREEGGLFS